MEEKLGFEAALEKLQQTVKSLEGGELNLEVALKRFEEGVHLIRICQEHLAVAEQKVEILTKAPSGAGSSPETQPFNPGQ
ncbi:exodeoxyribonuclease VII small subunit [bacterium]|jgi:exodeoxyribonuclease VII small subunit|nr:exodeoxyribonuclease VII small subunit [bacterium]